MPTTEREEAPIPSRPRLGDDIRVTVRRFDPTRDTEPSYDTFEVPYTRQMRVLDALTYIVEILGEPIAHEWFCGVKKCGACGVVADGKPILACWEPLLADTTIEPLDLRVIRDLVVDRESYEERVQQIEPWLQREGPYPGFAEHLTSTEMQRTVEMMHCIQCLLCVSACPSYVPDEPFAGPAAMVQLARFVMDPRDGRDASAAALAAGIEWCDECNECTAVCPTGIMVYEHALAPLRRSAGLAEPANPACRPAKEAAHDDRRSADLPPEG